MDLHRSALAELREQDEQLGINPQAFERPVLLGPPAPPAAPFVIERPDWEAERIESVIRERAARAPREPAPPLPYREDEEARPARPKPRTPLLDEVAKWQREQMVPDPGSAA